jgi:alkylhydroperoxidase family enzyme
LQGQDAQEVDRLAAGATEEFSEREQALLDYVKVLTLEPAEVRDAHVERMRKSGWNDEQIFEASFITSLFAFFNRMADAYGLDYPANGWFPPELRPAAGTAAAGGE